MITFYGYAVKKDGKYLGCNPKRSKRDNLYMMQYYKSPRFPLVGGNVKTASEMACTNLGEVVKVKLTMEDA